MRKRVEKIKNVSLEIEQCSIDELTLGLLHGPVGHNREVPVDNMGRISLQILAQVVGPDALSLFQHNHAFNDVAKLADVSRPAILNKDFACLVCESLERNAVLLRTLARKMIEQDGNIFAALAQRWNPNIDRSKPKVQIGPEALLLNLKLKALVRCGDDACI